MSALSLKEFIGALPDDFFAIEKEEHQQVQRQNDFSRKVIGKRKPFTKLLADPPDVDDERDPGDLHHVKPLVDTHLQYGGSGS